MMKDVLCYYIKRQWLSVSFVETCLYEGSGTIPGKNGTSLTLAQLSFGVSVRPLTWMSFLSCRDTQLSQLRLVYNSPTISHMSASSQYLSIVSWYLKQMAKVQIHNFRMSYVLSECNTCYRK